MNECSALSTQHSALSTHSVSQSGRQAVNQSVAVAFTPTVPRPVVDTIFKRHAATHPPTHSLTHSLTHRAQTEGSEWAHNAAGLQCCSATALSGRGSADRSTITQRRRSATKRRRTTKGGQRRRKVDYERRRQAEQRSLMTKGEQRRLTMKAGDEG